MGVFDVNSVAVIGAPRETFKVGYKVFSNVVKNFKGKVYPINPKHSEVLGIKAYTSLNEIPESVDYVVSCIPASAVLEMLRTALRKDAERFTFLPLASVRLDVRKLPTWNGKY